MKLAHKKKKKKDIQFDLSEKGENKHVKKKNTEL